MHLYEVRPRKDRCGVDLISDALPFGRLWYERAKDAIGYANFTVDRTTLRFAFTMNLVTWTSLSRSTLNLLVLPCRENDYRPSVGSCTLRRKGTRKGVRLIDLQSLLDYINAHVEPGCVADKPQESNAPKAPKTHSFKNSG